MMSRDEVMDQSPTSHFDVASLNADWGRYSNPPEWLFQESAGAMLRRWTLGGGFALRPKRLSVMPSVAGKAVGRALGLSAWSGPNSCVGSYHGWRGFAGISNDLRVGTMVDRYARGLFPFCHVGPMKWWSPAERAVIAPNELHLDRRTKRLLRRDRFLVTFDDDFAGVLEGCAEPRLGKTPLTWITPRMMQSFWALHMAGYAHSVEVWDENFNLVGGLFGIAIGGIFFGESRFTRSTGASKVGAAVLHRHLEKWGFALRDAKWMSPHLADMGFRNDFEDQSG